MEENKKSQIDELYYQLMGYYPNKPGQAYEIISSAILANVLKKEGEHNKYVKGLCNSVYQLDGLLDSSTMIEAKDYTKRGEKVGRADLQKMQGALTDLRDINNGVFASATDFTRDAKKYAESSKKNPMQKEIIPVNIRPSTQDDEKGRIKTIQINIEAVWPDFQKGKISIIFAAGEEKRLCEFICCKESKENVNISIRIEQFYDKDFKVINTLQELTKSHELQIPADANNIDVDIRVNAFIPIQKVLFAIKGIQFQNVPIVREKHSFTITLNGNATMFIESQELGINKLVTDTDLKEEILKIIHND